MNQRRYQQVRELFDAVAGLEPAARDARLRDAEPEIRLEVLRLLKASDRGAWLDAPGVVEARPAPAERWEGRRLGPYELLSEIGQGGMGIVYLARRADGAFQKQVAVKIIRQDLATPSFLARFQREREILAKLEHPKIARLLDGGTTPNGLAYLVMEYIQGEPLPEYADSRSLPYEARLGLLSEIAAAVDYAHEQGVIHRDLKPSNIFVDRRGHVKLLDFGIAAWQQRPAAETEIAPTIALSPAYASPEQARGEATTKATDVYSFAMVAYELLAGRPPFPLQGLPLGEVLHTIAERSPFAPSVAVQQPDGPKLAALARERGLPPVLFLERLELTADAPLAAALSKTPADRPASAGSLVHDLAEPPTPPEPHWRRMAAGALEKWGELALFAALFPVLSAVGLVELRPAGWAIWGVVLAIAALRRTGWLDPGNPAVVIVVALCAFAGLLHWQSRPGTLPYWLFPAVLSAAAVWGIVYYIRGAVLLGERIFVSRRMQPAVVLMLVAVFVGVLASLLDRGPSAVQLLQLLPLLAQALLHLQIRRRGVIAGASVLPWRELTGYRWVAGDVLELQRRSRRFGGRAVKVAVRGEDRERIEELLDEWLVNERPASALFSLLEDRF